MNQLFSTNWSWIMEQILIHVLINILEFGLNILLVCMLCMCIESIDLPDVRLLFKKSVGKICVSAIVGFILFGIAFLLEGLGSTGWTSDFRNGSKRWRTEAAEEKSYILLYVQLAYQTSCTGVIEIFSWERKQ